MPSQSVLQYLARQRRKVEAFVIDWILPLAASAVKIKASTGLTASTQSWTPTAQPDYPRLLSVTGNASGISGNVVIYGNDASGAPISNTIALSGTSTVAGTKAFSKVTRITVPARTHGSGDEVSIGIAAPLGLPFCLPENSVLSVTHNGAIDTYPTVARSSTVLCSNYVTLNAAPGGDHNISLFGIIRK